MFDLFDTILFEILGISEVSIAREVCPSFRSTSVFSLFGALFVTCKPFLSRAKLVFSLAVKKGGGVMVVAVEKFLTLPEFGLMAGLEVATFSNMFVRRFTEVALINESTDIEKEFATSMAHPLLRVSALVGSCWSILVESRT